MNQTFHKFFMIFFIALFSDSVVGIVEISCFLICQVFHQKKLIFKIQFSIISVRPKQVRIVDKPVQLHAGQRVHLTCESEDAQPPTQLRWTKNGQLLSHDQPSSLAASRLSSQLVLSVTAEDHGKLIRCSAYHPQIHHLKVEDQFQLNVHCKLHIKFILKY